MNHYIAAALLLAAAIGIPLLWIAIGLPYSNRPTWWD